MPVNCGETQRYRVKLSTLPSNGCGVMCVINILTTVAYYHGNPKNHLTSADIELF